MTDHASPSQSAAYVVAAAATRIEEETRTLATLTAKLRGLCFVEPAELDRLRAVERAALIVLHKHDMNGQVQAGYYSKLRDALSPDWTLETKLQTAEGGKTA